MTEDEMVGRHHQFDVHEFEQARGVDDGQPGALHSVRSQRVDHDEATELKHVFTLPWWFSGKESCNAEDLQEMQF